MSPATRESLAARWMAATASRNSSGLPPLATIANGSKPPDSCGTACKSSSSTHPSGTPGGVDPPDQIAYFVGAGDAGQESKHGLSVPTRGLLARGRPDEDLDARYALTG